MGTPGMRVKASPEISGIPKCTFDRSTPLALSPAGNGAAWTAEIRLKKNHAVACTARNNYGNSHRILREYNATSKRQTVPNPG